MDNLDKVLKNMDLNFCGAGKHKISIEKLLSENDGIFLDVRDKSEVNAIGFNFNTFGIEVLNIPINQIPDNLTQIPKNKKIGIFCNGGVRASIVYAYLKSKGYETVYIITGGYPAITNFFVPGSLYNKLQNKE